MLQWIRKKFLPQKAIVSCQVITRDKHTLSRKSISKNTLKVLNRLHHSGYQAFLVGGGVRDILLGLHPKDFDVATNASPEEVKALFRNCRLIGRRFRLAHVYFFGGEIIEVATFRREHETVAETGMVHRNNVFGTLEEDVFRRDFTVNALYYQIADFSLLDFVGGLEDLHKKQLRLIGTPQERYREDPVRILRALRLASKLEFTLEENTHAAISENIGLLTHVSNARLFDEFVKMFMFGHGQTMLELLEKEKLWPVLFPCYREKSLSSQNRKFIMLALKDTDRRFKENEKHSATFLVAVLLYQSVLDKEKELLAAGERQNLETFLHARHWAMLSQRKMIGFPKKLAQGVDDIWHLVRKLMIFSPKKKSKLFQHPRFKASVDFLILRSKSGDKPAAKAVQRIQSAGVFKDVDG